jgi:single-strand DNA-binding protein
MGNLTRDPEVKSVGSGSHLANLSLAVNRRYSTGSGEKREEVTYVDITFWGKQAELFSRLNIKKGTPLLIEGRLHLESWEDKQSGQKRSKLKVVGESLQLVGGKREDGAGRPTARKENEERPSPGGGSQTDDYGGGYSDEPF